MIWNPEQAIGYAWIAWIVSWMLAAGWTRRTSQRPPFGAELIYRLITLIGVALIFCTYGWRTGEGVFVVGVLRPWYEPMRLWTPSDGAAWALVALAVLGFAFCWWARIYLGRLWSGSVTLKDDHRIVDTGPYGLVRHPIYTGLILAALATAALKGTTINLVGAALFILGCWIKARLEERFLRTQLGAEAYDAYARRIPMLVPGPPRNS